MSVEEKIIYFDSPGPQNTDATLRAALERAKERGIKYVVVASTTGETGVKAVDMFKDSGIKVVVVTHQYGFLKPGEIALKKEFADEITKKGGTLVIGTDVFTMVPRAFRERGGDPIDIVNATLRMFCQGMKVCVEIVLMAVAAGAIPSNTDVIAIAGTRRGADTAVMIKSTDISRMFSDLKIREIIAMPRK
ncbi:MAG: pyruvate kinase alpha/beta domain-containing protein [Candidatus Baldrarchaeia archaeon]